jgi:hypothetical protein
MTQEEIGIIIILLLLLLFLLLLLLFFYCYYYFIVVIILLLFCLFISETINPEYFLTILLSTSHTHELNEHHQR